MEQIVQPSHVFFVNPLFYFWVFSAALLGAAIGVVMMRNIIHSTLSLCLAFVCTAGIYIIFGAEFLAAAEIIIYAGAVTILIFFAMMLSRRIVGRDIIYKNRQSIWAMILAIGMAVVLISTLAYGNWNYEVEVTTSVADNTKMIGRSLMLSYTLVFWIAGLVLTISMIGALMLAKKD